MEDVKELFDKAVGEIERMLNTHTVVGEPMVIEGNSPIPRVSVGFGFGVGGSQRTQAEKGSGHGRGTGGGGVKPVALLAPYDRVAMGKLSSAHCVDRTLVAG